MIKNEINYLNYNKQFSDKLLEQRKFNKIQIQTKYVDQFCCTGNGHGPFAEFNDGSVKYDFSNLYNQTLLGYSHPLSIKLGTETILNINQNNNALNVEKLEQLKLIKGFNELISAHKNNILNDYTAELFLEGIFGKNERIESLTERFRFELAKLQDNDIIISFECDILFFSIILNKNINEVLERQQSLGLIGIRGEKNKIKYLPPITLTSLHIEEVFTIIKKSLE
jgi:acetylornithine/succinyldiaminopimelate/putrescine aminotransferase